MKIGIDAGCLGIKSEKEQTGVFQFAFNLLKGLTQIAPQHDYWLYSFYPIKQKILKQFGPSVKNFVIQPAWGWNYWRLPLALIKQKPDLFLGFSQSLPLFCPCPSLVWIHDLAFEHFPQAYPFSGRRLRRLTRQAVKKATKIAAISQATKKDLIKIYQISPQKITVVLGAAEAIFKPQKRVQEEKIKKKYSLPDDYFLFVGSQRPIKNLKNLIQAFKDFQKKSFKLRKLVLVGSGFEKLNFGNENKNILKLGFLPREDLPAIYSQAQALVFPSLYEGFGLPVLEAMACGTPVICSPTGSLPEVAGQAVLFVNPQDSRQISQTMLKISKNKRLQQKLKKQGLKQAKKFSWQKSGQEVLKAIETLEV